MRTPFWDRKEVLMEEAQEIDGICWQVGHTREYVKVAVPVQEKYQVNDILTVKVERFLQPHILLGEDAE